jgi:site-specific recombinase XerD
VPTEIVSKMLDHANIGTTLSIYAKHSQQQIDDAMDRVFEKQKNPES